jgi:hypothetical protein
MNSLLKVEAVYFGTKSTVPLVPIVLLVTTQGSFTLSCNKLVLQVPRSSELLSSLELERFAQFDYHLKANNSEAMDLVDFRYSIDCDSYLIFSDGAVLSLVSTLIDHSNPDSSAQVLRFEVKDEISPLLVEHILKMHSGTIQP